MTLCVCPLSNSHTHTHTEREGAEDTDRGSYDLVWSRLDSPLSAGDQDDSLSFPVIIHIQECASVWPTQYTCTTDSSVL